MEKVKELKIWYTDDSKLLHHDNHCNRGGRRQCVKLNTKLIGTNQS